MTMTQSTTFTGTADDRIVTITDLRYELERERQITLAHFAVRRPVRSCRCPQDAPSYR